MHPGLWRVCGEQEKWAGHGRPHWVATARGRVSAMRSHGELEIIYAVRTKKKKGSLKSPPSVRRGFQLKRGWGKCVWGGGKEGEEKKEKKRKKGVSVLSPPYSCALLLLPGLICVLQYTRLFPRARRHRIPVHLALLELVSKHRVTMRTLDVGSTSE